MNKLLAYLPRPRSTAQPLQDLQSPLCKPEIPEAYVSFSIIVNMLLIVINAGGINLLVHCLPPVPGLKPAYCIRHKYPVVLAQCYSQQPISIY